MLLPVQWKEDLVNCCTTNFPFDMMCIPVRKWVVIRLVPIDSIFGFIMHYVYIYIYMIICTYIYIYTYTYEISQVGPSYIWLIRYRLQTIWMRPSRRQRETSHKVTKNYSTDPNSTSSSTSKMNRSRTKPGFYSYILNWIL